MFWTVAHLCNDSIRMDVDYHLHLLVRISYFHNNSYSPYTYRLDIYSFVK